MRHTGIKLADPMIPFNKPERMWGEGSDISYLYGPERQRIGKQVSGAKSETTYYPFSGLRAETKEGTQQVRITVKLAGVSLERIVKTDESQSRFLLKDHLGSTDKILNEDFEIIEELSFDPWGARRNGDWSAATQKIESTSPRGFTGHEMDDAVSLVNMNARIYDPVLGRFLSADSIVPDKQNLQSYNRYSYVENRTMSAKDPSGHSKVSLIQAQARKTIGRNLSAGELRRFAAGKFNLGGYSARSFARRSIPGSARSSAVSRIQSHARSTIGRSLSAGEMRRFAAGKFDLGGYSVRGFGRRALWSNVRGQRVLVAVVGGRGNGMMITPKVGQAGEFSMPDFSGGCPAGHICMGVGLGISVDDEGNTKIDIGPVSIETTSHGNRDGTESHGVEITVMGFGYRDNPGERPDEVVTPVSVDPNTGDVKVGIDVRAGVKVGPVDVHVETTVEVPAVSAAGMGSDQTPEDSEDSEDSEDEAEDVGC